MQNLHYSWYFVPQGPGLIVLGPSGHGCAGFEELRPVVIRGIAVSFDNSTRIERKHLMQFHADELRREMQVPQSIEICLELPWQCNTKQY